MMKPERWRQVDQLFQAALERAPEERTAFISEACGDDDSLRCEVEALLAADGQAERFIEAPAYVVAAPLIVEGVMQSLLGKTIGHYQIISLLGKGGMGEVYRARDTKLDRAVALKILPEEMSADSERMRRFSREAKAASALNHPNVAHIYEIGEAEGVSFIAMEYVEGRTLAASINGHQLEVSEIVEIGSQIADTLEEAHSKGITHRDIKPANVMLTARGQVKVLDFGLAKIARPAEEAVASDISTMAKTAPGMVMGTAPYMSPEQALGREVDHRSDLFSLGVLLYEMATGRSPFAGTNTSETLDRILHSQPEAIARLNYDAPTEFERIVRKCLEKERERRYQSARELLVDLKNLKRDSASTAPPSVKAVGLASMFKRRQRSAFIVLATLILSGIGYVILMPPPLPKVTTYSQITKDGLQKGSNGFASLVTDGSRIYFSESVDEQRVIAQVSVTGGETVPIPAPLPAAHVKDISPSRTELLVDSGVGVIFESPLWIVPVLGGAPRRVGEVMSHAAAWSPDGQQIVYANGSDLHLAKIDGTESRKLLTVTGIPLWLRWSPDGSRLRFTVRDYALGGVNSLWEVAADGSNLHPLLPDWNKPANECCGNWTADGRYFVFQSTRNGTTNIWARREKAGLFQRASQAPVQLTFGPLNYSAPLPSLDGKRLFVVGEQRRGELARYDTKTQQWDSYLSGISAQHLDFSRDGAWVVYVTYPEGNLWRSKADGSQRLQLTYPPVQVGLPRWSPDGEQIAFTAIAPGKPWKAYLISAKGGTPQQLTPEERVESDLSWSQDGKKLVFSGEEKIIHVLDLSTRQVSKLPGSEGLYSPRWSPTGRYIAAREAVSQGKLMLYDLTTQKWTELSQQTPSYPQSSRDGKYIYFYSINQNDRALFRLRISDRKIERLASLKNFRLAIGRFGA
jgi:eukaryotic-like serine/threonine-protein kinase